MENRNKYLASLRATGAVEHYLDALRDSGVVNMFGARPFVEDAFRLSKEEASALLSEWMRGFSKRKGASS